MHTLKYYKILVHDISRSRIVGFHRSQVWPTPALRFQVWIEHIFRFGDVSLAAGLDNFSAWVLGISLEIAILVQSHAF